MQLTKHLLLLFILLGSAFCGCGDHKIIHCAQPVSNDPHYGFMEHGEFGTKGVNIYIVHVVNLKDWSENEYFTGTGWSKNKEDAKDVDQSDTCTLKDLWFDFIYKEVGLNK